MRILFMGTPDIAAESLAALLDAGLDSVNISLDTLRPEVFRQITARDDFAAVQAGLQAALESGLPIKLNCVPQAGVNEGELEALAALAKDNAMQVRFIEMMPIGYGAAMPCISGPELRARFARRWPELAPLSAAQEHALGDGPYVIDCRIDKDEFVLPMLPPGGSMDDIIMKVGE